MRPLERTQPAHPGLERRSPHAATPLRPWMFAWLGLPVLGIANGVVRDVTYGQVASELAAHQLSTAILLLLMAAYLWALMSRWPIPTSRRAYTIGGIWALLTILFEFGFGHYLTGDSWATLLHAYNVAAGRVWVAVPLWTMVGPEIIRRLRARR
jgi:hypothetical protein